MEIRKQIEGKKMRLNHILELGYPSDPNLILRHEEKQARAKYFLEELKEVTWLLDSKESRVLLVPLATFTKQLEKADFATIEFDGEFCKIATVQNFPSSNIWLVYIAPVEIC